MKVVMKQESLFSLQYFKQACWIWARRNYSSLVETSLIHFGKAALLFFIIMAATPTPLINTLVPHWGDGQRERHLCNTVPWQHRHILRHDPDIVDDC